MNEFHIPEKIPSIWFKKEGEKWYAHTHLGNTVGNNFIERKRFLKDKKQNALIFKESNIYLVSSKNNTFIPVSMYDEHEDGKPLLKEVYKKYGINPKDYIIYRPEGLNVPLTKNDNKQLTELLIKLQKYGYDISKTRIYTGYLSRNVKNPKITATEYINGQYNTDVVDVPLTNYGETLKDLFEKFRDIFAKQICGKYDTSKMKEIIRRLYFLIKGYGLLNEKEYKNILCDIDLYEIDILSEQELENKLFGYNGFRNLIHNRIRQYLDDEKFIKLVGNPSMLNNIISAM